MTARRPDPPPRPVPRPVAPRAAPARGDSVITAHVAALDARLRGPAALRRDLVAEVRGGLEDAADAHRAGGTPDPEAAAVAEFGTVDELAPQFQAELTTAQARRTALVVTLLFPVLLLGWDLLWSHGMAWPTDSAPPTAVPTLIRVQDVASVVMAGAGLALLLATLLRRARPRLLAALTAAVALAGATVCGGTAVAMNLANAEATVRMLVTQPAAAPALVASLLAVVLVAVSAVRTLRLAR